MMLFLNWCNILSFSMLELLATNIAATRGKTLDLISYICCLHVSCLLVSVFKTIRNSIHFLRREHPSSVLFLFPLFIFFSCVHNVQSCPDGAFLYVHTFFSKAATMVQRLFLKGPSSSSHSSIGWNFQPYLGVLLLLNEVTIWPLFLILLLLQNFCKRILKNIALHRELKQWKEREEKFSALLRRLQKKSSENPLI